MITRSTHVGSVRVLGERGDDVAETGEALVDPRALLQPVPRRPGGVRALTLMNVHYELLYYY